MYNNKENEDSEQIMKGMELRVVTYRARLFFLRLKGRSEEIPNLLFVMFCVRRREIEHG
jgi:hypothetical protein